jgi:hypothetical protein
MPPRPKVRTSMAARAHQWAAVLAGAIALAGVVGWRSLGSTAAPVIGGGASPNLRVTELMPYTKPLSDTLFPRHVIGESIVLHRDPFARQPVPQVAQVKAAAVESLPKARPIEAPRWIVSATLTGGARRAAIINDVLIYVGDILPGGMKLTSVEHDRVILTDPKGTAVTIAVREGDG